MMINQVFLSELSGIEKYLFFSISGYFVHFIHWVYTTAAHFCPGAQAKNRQAWVCLLVFCGEFCNISLFSISIFHSGQTDRLYQHKLQLLCSLSPSGSVEPRHGLRRCYRPFANKAETIVDADRSL